MGYYRLLNLSQRASFTRFVQGCKAKMRLTLEAFPDGIKGK